MDKPISAKSDNPGYVAFFMKRIKGVEKASPKEFEGKINRALIDQGYNVRITWNGGSRERYDAYPVVDTNAMGVLLADSTGEIVPGDSYNFKISYEGSYNPPSGYSSLHFNRYDYRVITKRADNKVTINARYYTIGPKAE